MRSSQGFTLVELLVVLTVIGIVAAIAIPNLVGAIDRGKQKRTMADLRTIGAACETYSVDFGSYPKVASGVVGTGPSGNVSQYLEPTYMKNTPGNDGWGTPFQWAGDATTGGAYTILSYAKGGVAQSSPPGGATTDLSNDIIYSVGSFSQWPEGQQK